MLSLAVALMYLIVMSDLLVMCFDSVMAVGGAVGSVCRDLARAREGGRFQDWLGPVSMESAPVAEVPVQHPSPTEMPFSKALTPQISSLGLPMGQPDVSAVSDALWLCLVLWMGWPHRRSTRQKFPALSRDEKMAPFLATSISGSKNKNVKSSVL